jgi:hypothetical protein
VSQSLLCPPRLVLYVRSSLWLALATEHGEELQAYLEGTESEEFSRNARRVALVAATFTVLPL